MATTAAIARRRSLHPSTGRRTSLSCSRPASGQQAIRALRSRCCALSFRTFSRCCLSRQLVSSVARRTIARPLKWPRPGGAVLFLLFGRFLFFVFLALADDFRFGGCAF